MIAAAPPASERPDIERSAAPPRPAAEPRARAESMPGPAFILPRLVRVVCSRLPTYPPALACAIALTIAAPRLIGEDGLAELDGKAFRIAIRDAGASVAFRVRATLFEPLAAHAPVDVCFTACAADFLLLATRRADPDTLFFERRLAIEGDTEAGLLLKNLLDAVEIPRWLRGD